MKKLILFTLLGGIVVLSSCYEGPPGPQGRQGPQGPEGPQGEPGPEGFVFEWENVDYAAASGVENPSELEAILPYPDDFSALASDVALVYLLWGTYDTNDGETVEIWRQLPQIVGTPSGTINYNFDFTKYDVRLFLQPDYDLAMLESVDTDDWVVRVVIVPGEFWNSGRIDASDYHAVIEMLGVEEPDIQGEIIQRR